MKIDYHQLSFMFLSLNLFYFIKLKKKKKKKKVIYYFCIFHLLINKNIESKNIKINIIKRTIL